MELSKYIDHTQLKAFATSDDIVNLCKEAIQYNFYAVCVNGCYVADAHKYLADSDIKIAAVVGFPLGASGGDVKKYEARSCINAGADEIDMVINIGFLKSGKIDSVASEIQAVKEAIGQRILKVIIETCYLTEVEKKKACEIAMKAGADYVKTSTGFGTGGARLEDVALMKEVVGDAMKVKAAGGIRDRETALRYIDAGVERIGTSSGITILEQS